MYCEHLHPASSFCVSLSFSFFTTFGYDLQSCEYPPKMPETIKADETSGLKIKNTLIITQIFSNESAIKITIN